MKDKLYDNADSFAMSFDEAWINNHLSLMFGYLYLNWGIKKSLGI